MQSLTSDEQRLEESPTSRAVFNNEVAERNDEVKVKRRQLLAEWKVRARLLARQFFEM